MDARAVEEVWILQDRDGLSWWDALVVSAAQIISCQYLLTEDLQEGRIFGRVTVIEPFRTRPDQL